jgi:6-pyruvoyltetrahydropterin/6-carboxytetrahydropterin synthase
MYRIAKKFEFSSAHRLDGLEPNHPCGRMHGHNYEVELYLESHSVDETGFVRDYRELDKFKQWLDDTFDHHLVNETIAQPTAEYMAQAIYIRAASLYPEVTAVRVSETNKTSAWYSPHSLPPMDTVLDVLETLAEEPGSNPDRQRLRNALLSLGIGNGVAGDGGAGGNVYDGRHRTGGGSAFGHGATYVHDDGRVS